MKVAVAIFAVAIFSAGCVHRIREFSECANITAKDLKIECGACTLQNKAGGALGTYEYRPNAGDGQRCVRVD
ncbi:MAG TPA: hypothetical protein VLW85_01135 [Myxococcales bacterium]|nr:hypothetical protein [Myxococcales bacterium]